MSQSGRPMEIERLRSLTPAAEAVLGEYYDALGVVQRDDWPALREVFKQGRTALWLAHCGGAVAGCVMARLGVPSPDAAECKRLYVRPAYRGAGAAAALMQALETYAVQDGRHWVYLDTHEAFAASVALYRKRGYEACARYNENPQATMFFRKRLVPEAAID